MIKLILTDLDGTFLDSKGSFDKEFYRQVKGSMDEQAIYFAPCTGKQCERVEELFGPELSKDLWILGDSATSTIMNTFTNRCCRIILESN